jgi:hypothetical protein
MLRKALWSGLVVGMTLAARRAASSVWRLATGEAPPVKK